MLAAKRLNVLEHSLEGSVVEPGAQGAKVFEESPCLVGGDTPSLLADEQGIENLGAPEGRHQGLISRFQQVEHLRAAGVCSSGKHQDRVTEASRTIQLTDAPRRGVA
jgi:hypothetical protein